MSTTTGSVTALTFCFYFPSEEDAELAPQTLGEVLDAFDGRDLVDVLQDDVLGCDVVVNIACLPADIAELQSLEAGLSGLLGNWASSSGGFLVV
jgi:hypothetical protein